MTWAASYLLMKTNSHYEQYDNLRKDLIEGKFYDGTSGSQYAWVLHTGSHAYFRSSKGNVILAPMRTGTYIGLTNGIAKTNTAILMWNKQGVQKTLRLSNALWAIT